MIKCFSFSKSLKQLFIIGLISCFTLLVGSSVNASYCGTYGSNGYNILTYTNTNTNFISNSSDSDYFRVSKNLNFLTNGTYNLLYHRYNGDGYSDGYGAVFWNNNKLYMYNANNIQNNALGYVDNFIVCDSFTGGTSACSFYDSCNLSSDSRITMSYSDFLANPSHGNADMVGMSFYYGSLQLFCLSYSNLGYSLCASSQNYIGNIIQDTGYWVGNQSSINDYPFMSHLNYSPFSSNGGNSGTGMYGTGIVGPTTGNINLGLTGDYTYYNCTYGVLIDYAENMGMSKNLCYGGLDNFELYNSESTYNPVPGTGKTLGQITTYLHSTWNTPNEWFNFWNGLRGGYSIMWESYPAVNKTWFDLYYQYNGNSFDFDTVYEYCLLRVSDVDFANTVYKGQYFGKTCEYIKRNYGDNLYTSGDVVVGINWGGVGNLSGTKVSDPVVYIQDFFNLLKQNLGTRTDSGVGAIPSYIILFLLAIILFRFIKRK